jgi:MFS family permease
MNSRRSWVIFGASLFAYIVAVMQRSSIGIAGVDATERFGVTAAALSSLAVIQLVVYAALQIPVGVVLDRVGPRALIAAGAALMLIGQLVLAFAPSLTIGVIGRVLVGAGDAMTFISVIRLLSNWFSGRTLPIVSQWIGTLGQAGQILSAIPLLLILHQWGWAPAFTIAATASLVALVVTLAVIANSADGLSRHNSDTSWHHAIVQLRESLARPGTQLGFWSHFSTQSSGTVLSLLWGFPFFSVALGYGPATASLLISLIVASAAVTGPILGMLTARYPYRRSNIVLGIIAAMAIVWTAVLAWPGHPPFWLIVVLVVVVAIGGPGSIIGFDFARTFNPMRSLGSANGIVNVGGFLASFVMMFLIGVILDIVHRANGGDSALYSLEAFRYAFLVQYVVVGIGVAFLLRSRRHARRQLHAEEGIEVAPLWVSLTRALRRRNR